MYQRLDKMRKNAFASMCVFGIDNDSSISGIWIWRGQDLAFEVSVSGNAAVYFLYESQR
jgi:elongation factor 1-gamma